MADRTGRYSLGSSVKTILNPRKILLKCLSTHSPEFFDNVLYVIDENINRAPAYWNNIIPKKIIIHHYFTKSKEEFMAKKVGSIGVGSGTVWTLEYVTESFEARNFNDEQDTSMLYYVEKMKSL